MGFVQDWMKAASKGVKQFVAFVFLIFTIGMLFALFIQNAAPMMLFVPPLLGLAAFYDEKIAYLCLAGIVVLFFI